MNDQIIEENTLGLVEEVRKEPNDGVRWQMAVEAGRLAREKKDQMQWLMGDLAVAVTDLWGSDALDEYATQIGCKKNTLMRYAIVSRAFPPEKREARLSHRHHMILASRIDRFEMMGEIKDRDDVTSEKLTLMIKRKEGSFDEDYMAIRVLLSRGELQRLTEWYLKLQKNFPELLHDDDHLLLERLKQNYQKMKHLAVNGGDS